MLLLTNCDAVKTIIYSTLIAVYIVYIDSVFYENNVIALTNIHDSFVSQN